MFQHWFFNFQEVVLDAYGEDRVPFQAPTTTELKTLYEAGLDPDDALAQLEALSVQEFAE